MPYPNEHSARINAPGKYKRIRRENDKFKDGIHAIWGVKHDDKTELQAIRFDKTKYTVSEAKKWLKDNNIKYIMFEEASGKQLKSFNYQVKDIDEKGIITKYVNAFGNIDADGDISQKGSFTKTINERFNRVKWFLNHDTRILLGVPLEAKQDDFGLLVRSQLNMNKQVSKDIYEDYKLYAENDRTLEHSIGVIAIKRGEDDDRIVKEWKWFEYSTLTFLGANELTNVVDIKQEKNIEETIDLLEQMLKGNYSDERYEQIENTLSKLKSLINESSEDTHESVDAIEYLRRNIKILNDG